jgi:hypothetical protein
MLPRFHIGSKIAFANRRYRISTSPIFPRKWSILYSWSSARYSWISSASSRADCRSWPNGFSTTTRAPLVRPAPASPAITRPNRNGGTSR